MAAVGLSAARNITKGNGTTIISDANGFDWTGAYFADYGGNLNVTMVINFKGYNADDLLYDESFSVNSWSATWIDAGWTGITDLHITPTGSRSWANWAMDNFTYDRTPDVPEPSSLVLLGLGIAALAAVATRRRHAG